MHTLVPAAGHAVLRDGEVELCMRHYIAEKPPRPWIAEGDTAPQLVWDFHEGTSPQRDVHTAQSAPSDTRWRDQYLKLQPPKQAAAVPSVSTVPKKETEYVLISEDEEEDEGPHTSAKSSLSSSQPSQSSAAGGTSTKSAKGRGRPATSPSPRRSGSGAGVSVSQTSRASQRQSTGSSVVYVSQPVRKVKESEAPPADGGEVGKKRQRSMEEFLFRDA